MIQSYQVKLEGFEGPLDLLLHLINQYEIDIYDIPVAQITKQYMRYIHTMQKLELNIASEYLVMASTLINIKSEMLLPQQEPFDDEIDDYMEDPREELIERLIEYRKYKNAAHELKEREEEANQIYTRPPFIFDDKIDNKVVVQGDLSIYDMLGALGRVFQRKNWNQPLERTIQQLDIPIEERMDQVLKTVQTANKEIAFEKLFIYPTKSHIVVTFIAILELLKTNQIHCKQTNHLESLMIYI